MSVLPCIFSPSGLNVDQVTSWDTKNGVEQTTYEDGRSYINCVSEIMTGSTVGSDSTEDSPDDCDGAAKNDMGECRMVRIALYAGGSTSSTTETKRNKSRRDLPFTGVRPSARST